MRRLALVCVLLTVALPARAQAPLAMANPASLYCQDNGGRLEIHTTPDGGQMGICVFDDGSSCEEWAFLKGQCQPGKRPVLPPDPTAKACVEAGGMVEERRRSHQGRDYGSYKACLLPQGRQCELVALAGGFCPQAGVDVSSLRTPAAVYCAVLGGRYSPTRTFPQVAYEREEGRCLMDNGADCDAGELYRGQCRQRFNEAESGWRYLRYGGVAMLVGFPERQVVLPGMTPAGRHLTLTVKVESLGEIDGDAPMGYGRDVALADRDALASGTYGHKVDVPAMGSEQVVGFPGGVYGKAFTVLAREGRCRPVFERRLLLFRGDRRVTLVLTADADAMTQAYPEYFLFDMGPCVGQGGGAMAWREVPGPVGQRFAQDVAAGRLPGLAAAWWRIFGEILEGLVFEPQGRP